MSALARLGDFEVKVDAEMAALPILQLPIRVPLSGVLTVLHGLIHGDVRGHRPPRPGAALSLAGRLSRLMPLFAKCPAAPVGADAQDVHGALFDADPKGEQLASLVTYAHFADLMAEVHRGYFTVEQVGEQEFRLSHPSREFSDTEKEDILYSEIALGFQFITKAVSDDTYDRLIESSESDITPAGLLVIRQLQRHFTDHVFDVPLIGESGLIETFGLTLEQFRTLRAAIAGLAEYCTQIAQAYIRRWANTQTDHDYYEFAHWIAPVWTAAFFNTYLHNETGLTPEQINAVLPFLTVDFRSSVPAVHHASDGYLPPVFLLPDAVLFGSDIVLLFVQLRNLLFALQRTSSKKFDDVASKHLEPALLRSAHQLLTKIPFLEIAEEFKWKSGQHAGEIDLLVYDPRTNMALHIQAKAPLPPQGARLVERLEGRLAEGILQLERFDALPEAERDRIIGQALGHPVACVQIVDVLLARSCFGTQKLQSRAASILLLNLALISGAVTEVTKDAEGNLLNFTDAVQRMRAALFSSTRPEWSEETLVLKGTQIHAPMLTYDEAAVARWRLDLWRGNASMGL